MIVGMFKGIGRFSLLLATAAFLAALSLLVFGSYLMTWPLLRKSPRNAKIQAAVELASAGLTLLSTFQSDSTSNSDSPERTQKHPKAPKSTPIHGDPDPVD